MFLLLLKKFWPHLIGVGLLLWAGFQLVDYIGDRREVVVRAEYAEKERKQAEAQKKLLDEKEKAIQDFNQEVAVKQEKFLLTIENQRQTIERLNIAFKNLKATKVLKEVPSENGKCSVINLTDGWMRCYNAANSRSQADIEACEAAGMFREVSPP
jgi:hypothetical protein